MNNLEKALTSIECKTAEFDGWIVPPTDDETPSGYLRKDDVIKLIQKAILNNSCIGKKGEHELMHVATFGDACPGVERVVRWCKICGAIVIDRDFDGRTQPGGVVPMQHPQISVAASNLTHVEL